MKKIIVTGGGCIEKVDAVRSVRNSSSGKLAAMIIDRIARNDTEITYIHGLNAAMPGSIVYDVPVAGVMDLADEMEKALKNGADFVIHAMAVSDYVVNYVSTPGMLAETLSANTDLESGIIHNQNVFDKNKKLSSDEENIIISMKKAPKVIKKIKEIVPETCLIGFKLLNNVPEYELVDAAMKLKEQNQCDYVVANDLVKISETNHYALLIGEKIEKLKTKTEIADKIADIIHN